MKGDFDGELRRRMEDACLLPTDHPLQREVRDEITAAGDWTQQDWLELQRENEELRLALHDVTSPTGLEQRLIDIPSTSTRHPRLFRVPLGVSAAILMIIAVLAVVMIWPRGSSTDGSIAHVASLVAKDHSSRPELTVLSDEPQQAVDRLQPSAPFEIRLNAIPDAATLIGGRICNFDEGPLILTRWQTSDHEFSMYQLRLADFGIPPNLPQREIISPAGHENKRHCRVRLWSDDQFAYAIVSDVTASEDGA